jgi:tRNA-dihydrouridine synthase B
MKNFWDKLNKPFYALAPLAGVGDQAFRELCKEYGADLVYSEMASVAALAYAPEKTFELLEFRPVERPFVVQLFGSDPAHFATATKLVTEKFRPDGIDINFGCPVPKVARQKAGAELFKDIKLSRKIIEATINSTDLPVSIKTRTEAGETKLLPFLDTMKDLDIKAIMIHGRTLKQGFSGGIDCEVIKKARDYFGGVVVANGGVVDRLSAEEVLRASGADGVGVGRGAFGRPWIFEEMKNQNYIAPDKSEIFKIMIKHAELALKYKGQEKFHEMRKHLCWYVQGFPGAKELRGELIQVDTLADIKKILKQ